MPAANTAAASMNIMAAAITTNHKARPYTTAKEGLKMKEITAFYLNGCPYYYVPSMFIGTEKLYEAQPGQSYDEIKSHVKAALDAAMA